MKQILAPDCRLLLVEDDHLQLLCYTALLEEEGFKVFPANTPREALQLLRMTRIDLIITDLKMPGADGIELIDYIRKNDIRSEGRECPVVIFSCDELSDAKAKELGADKFCAKRNAKEKLPEVIRSLMK